MKFSEGLTIRRGSEQTVMGSEMPNFLQAAAAKGNALWLTGPQAPHLEVKGSAEMQALQELMRQSGANPSKEQAQLSGAAFRDPIRLLARYKEWTNVFFAPMSVGEGEDNAIPIDNPIGSAFVSSPEGRVNFITPGVQQFVRPTFTVIKAGLRVYWQTLRSAGWAILSRRMEETADSMARLRDVKALVVLEAAIAANAGHTVATAAGGKLTKAAIDAVVSAAAQIGFPVTQIAMNPGRIMDMSTWTFGTTSAIPWSFAPAGANEQMFRQLYAEGYAGLRYVFSTNISMNACYLSGDPSDIGYHQDHGQARSMSDVNINDMTDEHIIYEDDAWYVGNPVNLWKITITA